jgi:hypothetical protein
VKPEVLVRAPELLGHRGGAHQPVVGVQAEDDAGVVVLPQRVRLERGDGARLHVGGQADLDGDAEVVHVAHQVRVLEQARAVADAVRVAVVQRLVDALRAVRLAGVDGGRHVLVDDGVEGVLVLLGRVVVLRPRQVERHHAAILVRHRQVARSREVSGSMLRMPQMMISVRMPKSSSPASAPAAALPPPR